LPPEYLTFKKYKHQFFKTGNEYKNCIGGVNDMKPFGNNYVIISDTVSADSFSEDNPFYLKNTFKSHLIYLDISFEKRNAKLMNLKIQC